MVGEISISHDNYDILFKLLTEPFAHKALDVFDLKTVLIVRAEKVELPKLEVKTSRMDFAFLLEDHTYLHLEFQMSMTQSSFTSLLLCLAGTPWAFFDPQGFLCLS